MERLANRRRKPAVRRKLPLTPIQSVSLENAQTEETTHPAEEVHVANILLSLNQVIIFIL